ncbi:hypothetical protein F4775DRAFT_578160 [Biscogniauxia sp. FL1348]|nr:hypothetical protein F4775DRAFT_578160 [Biscogniauxia sp. FL1348]
MLSPSCRLLVPPAEEPHSIHSRRYSRKSTLLEIAELVPAVACSFVTTSYVLQEESPPSLYPLSDQVSIARSIFIIHTSPGLVLSSCLILGCCLSSYTYGRREQDHYQLAVFAVWVIWAVCVGWKVGCSADMITLGIVPWTFCIAMLSSSALHAAMRRNLSRKYKPQTDRIYEEKVMIKGLKV